MLANILKSAQIPAPAGGAQVEFINAYYDDANSSTYTYSGIPVTPGLIVVAVHGELVNHTINSVTIEGGAATLVATITDGSGGRRVSLYQRSTTTTGSISVVVNFSGTLFRSGLGVWRVYDNLSDTPATTATASGSSQPSLSVTLNSLPSNSVVIAACTHGLGGVTHTWSNVTERYDSAREGTGSQFSGADASSASGNYTVTATFSSSTDGQVLAAAAWN